MIHYLTKRFLDTVSGMKPKNHNLGTYESNNVFMINDIFSKMELMH